MQLETVPDVEKEPAAQLAQPLPDVYWPATQTETQLAGLVDPAGAAVPGGQVVHDVLPGADE